jgi:hypothetical protein
MEKKTEKREEYWRERVTAYERSGLSVKQFSEQQQVLVFLATLAACYFLLAGPASCKPIVALRHE